MQEFLAGTLNLATLNKAENLKAAFATFDANGDGKITRDELEAGLKVRARLIIFIPCTPVYQPMLVIAPWCRP